MRRIVCQTVTNWFTLFAQTTADRDSFRAENPVAIKVASLATLSTSEAEQVGMSILNEIEMSKRLSKASNHVVYMFDFDFHPQTGLAFLVMELGEKDLEHALQETGRLPSHQRRELWRQLVEIAVILHKNNIVTKLAFCPRSTATSRPVSFSLSRSGPSRHQTSESGRVFRQSCQIG
jgi:serine/threonine protein kinase